MKKIKKNGFILVIVIVTIALMGAEMFVLTGGSNAILFQANTAYLQAAERNLTASGLAWAEKNIRDGGQESFDKSVKLDITDMDIRRSALSITINMRKNEKTGVQIDATVSRGRQTLRRNKKYPIEL